VLLSSAGTGAVPQTPPPPPPLPPRSVICGGYPPRPAGWFRLVGPCPRGMGGRGPFPPVLFGVGQRVFFLRGASSAAGKARCASTGRGSRRPCARTGRSCSRTAAGGVGVWGGEREVRGVAGLMSGRPQL
jgi:hypothetical protein